MYLENDLTRVCFSLLLPKHLPCGQALTEACGPDQVTKPHNSPVRALLIVSSFCSQETLDTYNFSFLIVFVQVSVLSPFFPDLPHIEKKTHHSLNRRPEWVESTQKIF